MTATPLAISPEHISRETMTSCVSKYPSVLARVYATKHSKLSATEALEEDEWRYNTLPELLKDGSGMTKQQLARLVKWKITHGIYRPFLPGMIQKNAEADVVKHTSRAAAILMDANDNNHDDKKSDDEAYKIVEAALKEVTALTGVGPATGTLVLSVYDPERVPFFADELFAWVVPGHAAKLKYDKKEYAALWRGVRALQGRIGRGTGKGREKDEVGVGVGVAVNEVEKAAYVIGHGDVLEKEEREEVLKGLVGSLVEQSQEGKGKKDEVAMAAVNEGDGGEHASSERVEDVEDSSLKGINGESKRQRAERKELTQKSDGMRRSKRVKR